MGQDRQWVVDTLRRLGYVHEADEAARVLPDPVDMEQLRAFGDRVGDFHGRDREPDGGQPLIWAGRTIPGPGSPLVR